MTLKPLLTRAALALACTTAALPALAIQGGTATTAFAVVGQGVQVTDDWVLTVAHYTLGVGSTYDNGFGARTVAAFYVAPAPLTGSFPENDIALLRLVPLAASTFASVAVLGQAVPNGTFAGFDATIVSHANTTGPRAYGFTSITESLATIDPDDAGPAGPVPVNWLLSHDSTVYVQGGDSGGGLFLGHAADTSILLGLGSDQLQDDNGVPNGSGFVQPAAYRSWIDQTMLTDAADGQSILWVTAAVPEPAAWALWGAGLLALAATRTAARRSGGRNRNRSRNGA